MSCFFFNLFPACSAREVAQQAHIRGKEARSPPPTHPHRTLDEQLHLGVMFSKARSLALVHCSQCPSHQNCKSRRSTSGMIEPVVILPCVLLKRPNPIQTYTETRQGFLVCCGQPAMLPACPLLRSGGAGCQLTLWSRPLSVSSELRKSHERWQGGYFHGLHSWESSLVSLCASVG